MNNTGRGVKTNQVFLDTSMPAGVTDSAVFSGIAGGDNMSFFIKLTGAGGNVAFTVRTVDGDLGDCAPEGGGDIITVTDEVLHHCVLRFPVATKFFIRATNAGATVTGSGKTLSV